MASSESQSLQISLIVFVILTIVLAVTSFLAFRGYQEASAQAETDRTEAGQAKQALRTAQDQIGNLAQSLGVATSGATEQDIAAAMEMFNEDMKKIADTFHTEQQSYHDALTFLTTSVQETNAQLGAAQEKVRELETRNETLEATKQAQIDEFVAKAQQAQAELAEADQAYADDRRRLNTLLQEREQKLREVEQDRESMRAALTKQIDDLAKELATVQQIAEQRQKTIENLDPDNFEVADGQIARVDQRRGLVWINLGRRHGLKRQITFSVFAPQDAVGGQTVRKGAIEVVSVPYQDVAEARVIDDDISNPIVPGDKIFTPLWRPGQQQHFAIAGFIDLDGDGKSDREMIRDLIRATGGVIDGELTKDGKTIGELRLQTRYLIVGDEKAGETAGLGEWRNRARDLGVRQITASKFLDLIGWKQTHRVLDFVGGQPGDFQPPVPDGGRPVSSTNIGQQFQPRRPPTSGTGRRRGQ